MKESAIATIRWFGFLPASIIGALLGSIIGHFLAGFAVCWYASPGSWHFDYGVPFMAGMTGGGALTLLAGTILPESRAKSPILWLMVGFLGTLFLIYLFASINAGYWFGLCNGVGWILGAVGGVLYRMND